LVVESRLEYVDLVCVKCLNGEFMICVDLVFEMQRFYWFIEMVYFVDYELYRLEIGMLVC